MPVCAACGVELRVSVEPGDVVTCWDCLVADCPEFAKLEAELIEGFRELLRDRVWNGSGWERKQ